MVAKIGDAGPNSYNGSILADSLDGKGGNDTLNGRAGDDVLIGGTGSDDMFGGLGNDDFRVTVGDTAAGETYDGGAFHDFIRFSTTGGDLDFTQSAILGIDELRFDVPLTSAGFRTAIFNSSSFGGGGLADDLLIRGDRFQVKFVMGSDTAINLGGVEFGSAAAAGNGLIVEGDGDAETIVGSLGVDLIKPGAGKDSVSAGGGNDVIILSGSDGAGSYNGGAGDEEMIVSGISHDFRNAKFTGIEGLTLRGAVRFGAEQFGTGQLAADLEITSLTNDPNTIFIHLGADTEFSAAGFQLKSGALDNTVLFFNGGSLGATVTGSDAADTFAAGDLDDILSGGGGNDFINGNAGGDKMAGGAGDDTYIVDSAGDSVSEESLGLDTGGLDLVKSTVDHALSGFVENLNLDGGALEGSGNKLANTITGNGAANVLRGLAGADVLIGQLGSDTLFGGGGKDKFVYDGANDSAAGALNRDQVRDFAVGIDKIDVTGFDANDLIDGEQAAVLDAGGGLTAGEFRLRVNNGNTFAEFNTDADAAVEMQIAVMGVTNMTAADVLV